MKGLLRNTSIVLALGLSLPAFADLNDDHWRHYEKGVNLEKKGDEIGAVQSFKKAYALNSSDAATLIKLSAILINSASSVDSDYEQAIVYLNKADSIKPGDALVKLLLAQAYQFLGSQEKSIENYSRAITIEPDNDLLKLNPALVHFERKEFKETIELLNKVILAYPDNLKARSYLGAALQATENYIAAIEQYNYVLNYEGDNFSIVKNIGDSWLALGDYDRAKKYFEKAQNLDPNVPDLYADIAYIEQKRENLDGSIENYKKALGLKENEYWRKSLAYTLWKNENLEDAVKEFETIDEHGVAAYIYQTVDQRDKAIEQYAKAIEKKPDDLKSRFNLGRLYHESKEYDLAKEQYLEIIERRPNDSETLYLLAVAEQEDGALTEAVNYYSELLEKYLAEPETELQARIKRNIHYNLGLAYKIKEELELSEDNFEKALELGFQPEKDLYRELISVKMLREEPNEAKTILNVWLKKDPTNLDARNLYADLLISTGKEREAIEQLRLSAALDSTDKTRLKLANLLHSQNNLYDALAEYQIVLRKDPKNLNGLVGAGSTYRSLGLTDEAVDIYKKAVKNHPDDLLANYNYGLALQEAKKYNEALEVYKKVQAINPEFVDNYYALGLCYWDLDNKSQALETWNKFLGTSSNEDLKAEVVRLINDYKVSLSKPKEKKPSDELEETKPENEESKLDNPYLNTDETTS